MQFPIRTYLWLPAVFVLFLIAVFYIHGSQTTYLIADEYLAYRFTRDDLTSTLSYLINSDVHPPLWFSFFWGWRRLVGDSDFAGRSQAFLFSFITLSVVFQLGKRWFGSTRFGIFTMLTLSVTGLFFQYSLQIRPYGLAMLLASLCMLAFQQWMTRKTLRAAVIYGASIVGLLYIHYFLLLLVLTQLLYFLLLARPTRRVWRQAIVAGGFTFLLFLPWMPSFFTQVQHLRQVELETGSARGLAGSSATTTFTSIESIAKFVQMSTNGIPGLYMFVLIVGLIWFWRKANYQLALVWGLGLPVLTFAVNTLFAVYNPRYIVNFIIGLAVLMAAGLASLPKRAGWVGIFAFAAINIWAMPEVLPRDIIPFRALFKEFISAYQPGDTIFIDPPDNRGVDFNWTYLQQFPLDMRESIVNTVEEALPSRRIWYLTPNWLNNNIQATFNRIEQNHPLQSVLGKCDINWCYLIQLLQSPPWSKPTLFGDSMAFWGADIDTISSELIQTRLWWRLQQAPNIDYSISLQIINEDGSFIAVKDGSINHYKTQIYSTSQLIPGEIYIDFRDIMFVPHLLPGTYHLRLVVYDWQTSERLTLEDGSDYLELGMFQID